MRAALAVEIRKERRGRTDAASENSRKDNIGEGVSCECPLRKSPPPSTIRALLRTLQANGLVTILNQFAVEFQVK